MSYHELFEELEAFDPKWQQHYPSLILAAKAAGVLEMYQDWLKTASGKRYTETYAGVPDTLAEIREYQATLEKARRLL